MSVDQRRTAFAEYISSLDGKERLSKERAEKFRKLLEAADLTPNEFRERLNLESTSMFRYSSGYRPSPLHLEQIRQLFFPVEDWISASFFADLILSSRCRLLMRVVLKAEESGETITSTKLTRVIEFVKRAKEEPAEEFISQLLSLEEG